MPAPARLPAWTAYLVLPALPALPDPLCALAWPAWILWTAGAFGQLAASWRGTPPWDWIRRPEHLWWAWSLLLTLLAGAQAGVSLNQTQDPNPTRALPVLLAMTAFLSLRGDGAGREACRLALAAGCSIALWGTPPEESPFLSSNELWASVILFGAIREAAPTARGLVWAGLGIHALCWTSLAAPSRPAVAALALCAWTWMLPRARTAARTAFRRAAGLSLLACALLLHPPTRGRVTESLGRLANASRAAWMHRLLGAGPGQFEMTYAESRTAFRPDDAQLSGRLAGPGLELLRQAIETGIPGLALWVFVVVRAVREGGRKPWALAGAGLCCLGDVLSDPTGALWLAACLPSQPARAERPEAAGRVRPLCAAVGTACALLLAGSDGLSWSVERSLQEIPDASTSVTDTVATYRARERLRTGALLWPGSTRPYRALARLEEGNGRSAEALDAVARIIRRDPRNIRALLCGARLGWESDRFQHAWRYYEELAHLFPDHPLWKRRAEAAAAQEVGRVLPPSTDPMGPLLPAPNAPPPDEIGRLRIWMHHRMPDEAEARARKRLRENPPDPDPFWLILADALAEQGRLKEALAAIQHVRPDTERCLVEANLQEKLGYRARAAVALRHHVEHAPEDVATRVSLALLLWDLGDWEAAETQFLEAARLRGTYPAPRRELGLRYAAWGRYAQARDSFERFELLGGMPGANDLAHIALALHRTGEHERARTIVARLLEGAPTAAPGEIARLHLLAGSIAVALEHPAEAETSFRAALNSDPQDPDAHYNLGVLLASQGRLSDALQHFDLSKKYGYPVFAIPTPGDRGGGRR